MKNEVRKPAQLWLKNLVSSYIIVKCILPKGALWSAHNILHLPCSHVSHFMRDTLRAKSAQGVCTTHTGAVGCAGQSRGLAGGVVAGVLHLCFELTQHGDSIAAILPGLSAALQQEPALCAPLLPSLALLAQLSPQSTADDIMAEMLSLCSSLPSIRSSVRGVVPPSIYTAVCG